MKKNKYFVVGTALLPQKIVFRIAGVLLLLTMLSFWMVCGMLARYTSTHDASSAARIALPGGAAVYEHKAVYDSSSGVYSLNTTLPPVMENRYQVVVPGMTIPKDPYILVDGSQEVNCQLYLEICESETDWFRYQINSDQWELQSLTGGTHGGKVYLFRPKIAPHETLYVYQIFEEQKITVSDTLKAKETPALPAEGASITLYATLVQTD